MDGAIMYNGIILGKEVSTMNHTALRRVAALALALMLLCGLSAVAESDAATYELIYSASNPIPEIAERCRPAIVQISSSVENWNAETRQSSVDPTAYGSATFIREDEDGTGGYLLTNYHIVKDADVFGAEWLDGTKMDIELVGYDDGTDIAVMRFEDAAPEKVQPIPMGDSDALKIGELAICIGNPGTSQEVLYGTVTAGIISGLQREDINAGNFSRSINVIQTDAPINSGNSGGALLNARGELVGIPTLKMGFTYSDVFEGLSFCIPISAVKGYIDQLIDNGKVVRPRMGVTVTTIDGPEEAMKRYPPCGAQVVTVEAGAPADKAGLKENDVITEVNGSRVRSASDVVSAIDKCADGEAVKIKYYRYNYDSEGQLTSGYTENETELVLELLD